jgi:hypothetical protein
VPPSAPPFNSPLTWVSEPPVANGSPNRVSRRMLLPSVERTQLVQLYRARRSAEPSL